MISDQDMAAQANGLGRNHGCAFVDEHTIPELELRPLPRSEAGRDAKPPHSQGATYIKLTITDDKRHLAGEQCSRAGSYPMSQQAGARAQESHRLLRFTHGRRSSSIDSAPVYTAS
jgi:hypothetical protein